MKIVLIGLGTVGQAFYNLLKDKGREDDIAQVIVKDRQKTRSIPNSKLSFNWEAYVQDPSYDVVVELTDDAKVAREIAELALRNGKVLISANKKMLAENLPDLVKLSKIYGGSLHFEAAVAGAIPVIRTLNHYFEQDEILGIEGILNGSSNYILDQINAGADYESALKQAQDLGFAESNPYLDVSGWDAAYKLSLLIFLANGDYIPPSELQVSGLEYLAAHQKSEGKVKLVAEWHRDKLSPPGVALKTVHEKHPLASIPNEENAILLHSRHGGSYLFRGKGAGAKPTAWAVYSDLKNLWPETQKSAAVSLLN